MLLVSLGLLGLAALAVASLQFTQNAQFQMMGWQLATDYIERMQANVEGFQANGYALALPYGDAPATTEAVPACRSPARCSAAEMAAADRAQWQRALRLRLPGGGAWMTRGSGGDSAVVDLWLAWGEGRGSQGVEGLEDLAGACPASLLGVSRPDGLALRCLHVRGRI